jgi:hypothetical protein
MLVLTAKSLKCIYRNSSVMNMLTLSTALVFAALLVIFYSTNHATNHFLDDKAYQRLQFNVVCETRSQRYACHPLKSETFSPSDLAFNPFDSSDSTTQQLELVSLLSSMFLNGMPIVDLNDYVLLSDYANSYLGSNGRSRLLASRVASERLGNLLMVRSKLFALAPRNEHTEAFMRFLQTASSTTQVNRMAYAKMRARCTHLIRFWIGASVPAV